MTDYLLELLPSGASIVPVPDLQQPALAFYKIVAGEEIIGTFWVNTNKVQITVQPDTTPPPDPTPTPDPVIPSGYRLKLARNMRQSADLQSALVATISQGATVKTLTNEKPTADGLVWRRVEWKQTETNVHVGWLAVCEIGDGDGVGSWIEALGAG